MASMVSLFRGVRFSNSFILSLVCISLLILQSASSSHAALFTIDLGSETLKVSVVAPRKGQSPFEIAINEMSKRKSPALVAISNGERLLSEEAAGITARYPDRVYSRIRDMAGKPVEDVEYILKENYLPYKLVKDPERGTVRILGHDGVTEYTVEALLALIIDYGRRLAEQGKGSIKDAVISVPPYFGQSQRQAILDAAQLVGISVLALIQEHAAVAVQYGIDKDFSNGSRNVVIYDMGANSVYAAVIHYSTYSARKNVSSNQFQVKGIRWDTELGGQTLERRLLEYFADEFNQKSGLGVDVRTSPKAMAKLRKEVKRTKEILSANTEAPLNVESLFEDKDFRTSITREKFENLCEDLWVRAVQPLKLVLEDANLTLADIDAVELVGGATRVPKLQSVLSGFLENRNLDRHLDADEALALGSSLVAANLSDSFKLYRGIGMVDGSVYGILFQLRQNGGGDTSDTEEDGEGPQVLFPRLKKLPSKVIRSFKHLEGDFSLELLYDVEEPVPSPLPGRQIKLLEVSGVANVTAKYKDYNLTAPMKTSVHFSLNRNGMVDVDKAEVVVEFHEWVEVPIELPSTNATVNESSGNTTKEGGSAPGEDSDSKGETTASDESTDSSGETKPSSGGDESADRGESTLTEVEKLLMKRKLRKRTLRIPLKVTDVSEGVLKPMSTEDKKTAFKQLEKLAEREREKRATEEAKNSLEAFIYATKDKLEQQEETIKKVTTPKERNSFGTMLNEAEDWLYSDGENAKTLEFQQKLGEVSGVWSGISLRMSELTAWPKAVEEAKKYITSARQTLDLWEETKPWIEASSKTEARKDLEKLEIWLKEKDALHKKASLTADPDFTSSDIVDKVAKEQKKIERINRIPKPKPVPPPKAPETSNDTSTGGNETDIKQDTPPESESGSSDGKDKTSNKEKHDEL